MAQVTRTIFGCLLYSTEFLLHVEKWWPDLKCDMVESISSRLVFIYYYLFIYIFSGFCATDVIDINICNAKWKEKKSHLTSLSTDCSSDFTFMYRYLNICI